MPSDERLTMALAKSRKARTIDLERIGPRSDLGHAGAPTGISQSFSSGAVLRRAALLATATIGVIICCLRPALAQELNPGSNNEETGNLADGVFARVAMSAVYDDNVYRTAIPTGDFIWRISPEVIARHDSPRLTFSSTYGFDAERFAKQADLSAPLASQTAVLDALWRVTSTATLGIAGGYRRASAAADLNTTTGLSNLRVPASAWHTRARLRAAGTSRTELAVEYLFTEGLYSGGNIATQDLQVRLARQFDEHNQGYVRAESRWFQLKLWSSAGQRQSRPRSWWPLTADWLMLREPCNQNCPQWCDTIPGADKFQRRMLSVRRQPWVST
jgi:hypothetical protein